MWPARWNSASFSSTTVWPRWMSAVVGSIPSFTRSGRPPSSCSASRPSGSTSTAFRVRSGIGAMLDCRLRSAGLCHAVERFPLDGRPWTKAPAAAAASLRPAPPASPPRPQETAPEEAAGPLRAARARHPRRRLDGLRDDGRGLPGPAGDLQLRPVQGREEQRGLRRQRRTDRHPDQRPEQNPAQLGRRSPPTSRTRWSRSRTPASTSTTASTSRASAAPWSKTSSARAPPRAPRRSPSSSSRTRSKPQGDRTLFEKFKRGGARLPARAPLEQGQDPHRVPEHDLLRRGRLRDRGRGAHLLRRRPPRLRHRDRALRLGARALGGGDCWPGSSLALGLRPQGLPRKLAGRRNLVLEKMDRTGLHLRRADARRPGAGAARAEQHRTAEARLQGPLLHRLPAPAAGRTLRRLEGLLRRPQSQVDARPAAAGSGRRSGQLLPRLLAGDRLGGRDRQPQRRDQGDGRRARLRHQALQPGDPGPPPAGLLDQALHPDHRARRGDLARNGLPLRRALLPLRQERRGNLPRHQRRGLLPRLLRHRLRDDLLGQLDLRRARRSKG